MLVKEIKFFFDIAKAFRAGYTDHQVTYPATSAGNKRVAERTCRNYMDSKMDVALVLCAQGKEYRVYAKETN